MLTAKEVAAMERTRKNVRKETYRAILEQLCRKIRAASIKNQRSARLTIPPFMLGYPPFDVTQAVTYITRQLENLGYQVYRQGLIDLEVTWFVKDTKKQNEIIDHGDDILPSLVNLQKTANMIRGVNPRL
jgi:hypothetical protein